MAFAFPFWIGSFFFATFCTVFLAYVGRAVSSSRSILSGHLLSRAPATFLVVPLFRSSILRPSRWTSSCGVCFDFRRSCLGLDFPSIFFLPLSPPSVSVSVSVSISRDGFVPDRPSFDSQSSIGSVPSSERDDWGSFGSLDPVWVRSLPISLGSVRFQPVWFGRDGGRPSAKEQLGRPLPTQPWEHRCVQVPAPLPRDGQPIPHRGRRGHHPKTRTSPTGHAARVREERSKEKGKEGKTCPENSKRGSDGS